MMPFFSIIIPVYNVAPYLRECLDSILSQTFMDWEAICVDDGSTDGSGAILDEYAARDSRIRVIHQPNAGVSAARNAALDIVRGKYFGFMDPDDILHKEYIEHLVSLVKDKPGWVGAIGWEEFLDGQEEPIRLCHPAATDGAHAVDEPLILLHTGTLWNRIYPTTLLESQGARVRFFSGLYVGEDTVFVSLLLSGSQGVIVDSSYSGYRYRLRQKSLCHGRSERELSICYWDDTLALSRNSVCGRRPELLKEFISYALSGHIFSLRSFADVFAVVKRIHADGVTPWSYVVLLADDNCDFKYDTLRPKVARMCARVLLSKLPMAIQAGIILLINFGMRARGWVARRFNHV